MTDVNRDEQLLVLPFFCGGGELPGDPGTGARGLLRCLIAQLLARWPHSMAVHVRA